MGFLDIFSRKNTSETEMIKREINEMKLNLKNLSEKVRLGDENTNAIYSAMEEMLKDMDKNARNIASLEKTVNLKQSMNSQSPDAEISRINSQLEFLESKMLENRKKVGELLSLSKLSIQNYDAIKEIKQLIHSNERPRTAMNLTAGGAHKNTDEFSTKETRILNALLNSEIPLTYEEIAAQVNISPITVKGYINSIKKAKSDIILESAKGKGRKVYSIKPEYRLKVLSGKK